LSSLPPSLPVSLDNFYPPKSNGPAYLMAMHQMAMPMSGIVNDLFQNDIENANANFEAFKTEYARIAEMIPEWKSYYPAEPVEQLDAAIKSGNPDAVMGAMETIGNSCHSCHQVYMPLAHQKYHWGEFAAVSITDPLSGGDVPFRQMMMMMESNMTGTGIDLKQGQLDNARKNLDGFEARFNAVAQTCQACHDTERKYFVSEDINGAIAGLKTALASEKIDPSAVGGMLQKIGQESCFKCHLVHIPAAYSQSRSVSN